MNRLHLLLKKKKEVCERNESKMKWFKERIELQNFYKENAPKQIELIRSKQKEIAEYLIELRYKEEISQLPRLVEVGACN